MTTGAEPLASARAKLARALEHVHEYEEVVASVEEPPPPLWRCEEDEAMGLRHYYLVADIVVPPRLSLIAGETMNCLRSTLDHVAYAMCDTSIMKPQEIKNLYFPIKSTKDAYEKRLKQLAPFMSADVVDLLWRLEPYPGGKDEDLKHLDDLNNIDKHRMLVTTAMTALAIDVRAVFDEEVIKQYIPEVSLDDDPTGIPTLVEIPGEKAPLKKGDLLASLKLSAPRKDLVKFGFVYALNEPNVVPFQDLHQLLVFTFGRKVDSIVAAIAAAL